MNLNKSMNTRHYPMISIDNDSLAKELEKLHILIIPKNIARYNDENQIVELYLSRYGIKKIPEKFFENPMFSKMQKLHLNSNKLSQIDKSLFDPLKDLKFLNLSRNNLKALGDNYFKNLRSLEDLDLSNNDISELEPYSFGGLSNLKKLKLKNNQLTSLADNLFLDCSNLSFLDLSINRFRTLSNALIKLPKKLSFLDLSSNYMPHEIANTYRNDKVIASFLRELTEFSEKSNLELNITDLDKIVKQFLFDCLMSVYHYSMNVPILNYSLLNIILGYMVKNFHLLSNFISNSRKELSFQDTITLWSNCLSTFEPIENALMEILESSEIENERRRRILERKQKMLNELEREIEEMGGAMDYKIKKSNIDELEELEPIHENLFNLLKKFMSWNSPQLSTIFL